MPELYYFNQAYDKMNFMTCLQVIYASSTDELNAAATEQLLSMPNKEYVQRVQRFLKQKAEWVLLFRPELTTRGHNTNNFAEASIRILKNRAS